MIIENEKTKVFKSDECNFIFNKETGFTAVWGKTVDDDPVYCPSGPMIADIEITTACSGPGGTPCNFCYKSNLKNGKNMSLDKFKEVFHKLPNTITQIAFGADADLSSNPDIWKIMDYCRNNDFNFVVPNITVADVSDEVADKLSAVCGAVAVSRYADKNLCYDSVKKLTDRGMTQVNIHMLLSEETYDRAVETIEDIQRDPRLAKLNAIVFLSLKQKGRGIHFNRLSDDKFQFIVDRCFNDKIRFGFDSCTANKFLNSVKGYPNYAQLETMSEPCESTLFSTYIDVDGKYYPCSFCEKVGDWSEGIDVASCEDFVKDIWHHDKTLKFRDMLHNSGRSCPIFNV
jgi:hypothetical protein